MTINGGIFKLQQVYNKQVSKTWPITSPGITTPITDLNIIDEGDGIVVNIGTTDYEGQTLYWTISGVTGTIDSSDFTAISGSFIVEANNFGTFTITSTSDSTTEGTESFVVQIRTDSTDGPVKATSETITINDTSITITNYSVEYLVVAGGAGGGGVSGSVGVAGGGGGAGGMRTGNLNILVNTNYTVTIGAGGSGGSGGNDFGDDGSTSTFASISSNGGGGGGRNNSSSPYWAQSGRSGACGGGGAAGAGGADAGSNGGGATGLGSGFEGGPGIVLSAGGGGGKALAGSRGFTDLGGPGGSGSASSITGSSVTYSGGGGGGAYTRPGGSGGSGGGGAGGGNTNSSGSNGVSGTGNLGGGGGGGGTGPPSYTTRSGGNGGSGVVIVAFPDTFPVPTISAGLSYTQPSRSGYRVYRFTGGTGTINFKS